MTRCRRLHVHLIAGGAGARALRRPQVAAQQPERRRRDLRRSAGRNPRRTQAILAADAVPVPPNTTVVPRSAPETKAAPGAAVAGQVSLVAVLTQDGQNIEQGLVWRVFRDIAGPDGKLGSCPRTRGEPDAAAGGRRLHRQRRVRPCQPDAQDRGLGEQPDAGALRAQRRRPAPHPRRGAAARPSTRRPSATRSTPTSATSTGSARR